MFKIYIFQIDTYQHKSTIINSRIFLVYNVNADLQCQRILGYTMNDSQNVPTAPVKTFRSREHRLSKMPIKDILKARIKDLGIKNIDVQKALDYPNPNVIAMMKAGKMNLPPEKAYAAAQILQLDPVFMIKKALQESNSLLHDSIMKVLGKELMTANELSLIEVIREAAGGHDIDFTANQDFVNELKSAVNKLSEHEDELVKAILVRKDAE